MPRSREDVTGENDGAHGEPTGDIATVDGKTRGGKGPEHDYVDADERPNPASSNRTPTLVSPDHDPSPFVPLPSSSNPQSSKVDEQRDANVRLTGAPATVVEQAECTRPLTPTGINVRRAAPARIKPRSLLQSVQAHLSLRPRSEHGGTKSGSSFLTAVPSHGADEVPQHDEDRNAARPSLLERLSDTLPDLPQDGAQIPIPREPSLYGDAPRSPHSATSFQAASAGIKAEERRSVDDSLTVMASTRTGE
ncbi:hypothetical protein FOMPIDRAFT_93494 [Fomitopsis schrenkii]|uniref:Uncharacterized protein n=1 Tax=Fomitopsis schrenkii TaxID=2126942 RepID=S8EZ83_FOMSC|nr:hypothetical protein FOMPIDRAFT_93494 [Fomitopsis schrenkii]